MKRFRNLSFLALEVESGELQQLQEMDEVISIAEDELWSPTLDASAGQIGADVAWAAGYTGIGQAIVILDTGVDKNHPNFTGKIVAEACFSTGFGAATSLCPAGENPSGADFQVGSDAGTNCSGISSCDHGTHVAGIAAGSSLTYRGIASDAYLIPIQVFSKFDSTYCSGSSSCILAYFSDVLRALDWVYEQRDNFTIASANLSLGVGCISLLRNVIKLILRLKWLLIIYVQQVSLRLLRQETKGIPVPWVGQPVLLESLV